MSPHAKGFVKALKGVRKFLRDPSPFFLFVTIFAVNAKIALPHGTPIRLYVICVFRSVITLENRTQKAGLQKAHGDFNCNTNYVRMRVIDILRRVVSIASPVPVCSRVGTTGVVEFTTERQSRAFVYL